MSEENRSHIQVACAIIERDGRVLAAQRSRSMPMPLKWEFPGGKIEPAEEPEACLHRELYEEMGLRVAVRRAMPPTTYRYSTFTVTLHPFVCSIVSGELCLNEHRAAAWLDPEELPTLDWLEADVAVIDSYRRDGSSPAGIGGQP